MEKARQPDAASAKGSLDTIEVDERPGKSDSYGEPDANAVSVEGSNNKAKQRDFWSDTILGFVICNIAAIEEYNEVKRELSRISRTTTNNESKLEEGNAEEFNLDDFLHGMSDQAAQAGTKSKQLGLIWRNLMVEVCIV